MTEKLNEGCFSSDAYNATIRALGVSVLSVEDLQLRASIIDGVNALHLLIRKPLEDYMSKNPSADNRVDDPKELFYGPGSLG